MNDRTRLIEQLSPAVPGLLLYARQWVDADAARDAVQEALIALLTLRSPPNDLLAWMYTAVRNAALDQAKGSRRRQRREKIVAQRRQEWFEAPVDALIDAESATDALRLLPAELREIVVMRIWGELGFAQIASICRISVSTAHERFTSALKQMRLKLENPCPTKMD